MNNSVFWLARCVLVLAMVMLTACGSGAGTGGGSDNNGGTDVRGGGEGGENEGGGNEGRGVSLPASGTSAASASVTFYRHYQGSSCAYCHHPELFKVNSEARFEAPFRFGGTVFSVMNGRDGSTDADYGYTIEFVMADGSSVRASRLGTNGNFALPLGRLQPSGPFTAKVIRLVSSQGQRVDQEVNRSIALSHTPDRADCNRCHTQQGIEGAPGRVVSFNTVPAPVDTGAGSNTGSNGTAGNAQTGTGGGNAVSTTPAPDFSKVVFPLLQQDCGSCHTPTGQAGLNGARFLLSDARGSYDSLAQVDALTQTPLFTAKNASGGYRLLLKATNDPSEARVNNAQQTGHGGGRIYQTTDANFITLLNWLQAKAPWQGTAGSTPGSNGTSGAAPTPVSFSKDIYPRLKTSCQRAGCHAPSEPRSFVVYDQLATTYNGLISNGIISSGNVPASLLYTKGTGSVSHSGGNALGSLATQVSNWIKAGAKNN